MTVHNQNMSQKLSPEFRLESAKDADIIRHALSSETTNGRNPHKVTGSRWNAPVVISFTVLAVALCWAFQIPAVRNILAILLGG